MALLDLATLKTFLNITGTGSDAELALYVGAVVDVVEGVLGGPVEQRSFTDSAEVSDAGRALMLRRRFVTAVTAITSNGVTVSTTDVYVSAGSVVRRNTNAVFAYTTLPVVVTYTAGIAAIGAAPNALTLAAAIVGAHLWDTQRGQISTGPGDDYAGGDATPGLGYAVPNRALELMAPWLPETSLVMV